MGRSLLLLAAIPLVAAGYFVRDSDLIAKGKLFVQAHLLGSGATEIVRPAKTEDSAADAPLPSEATALFRKTGKEPRADRIAELKRTQTVRKRPEVMVASMTPHPGAESLQDGPANTARINRSAKGPRLDPPAGSQVLLSHTSADAPELGETSSGVERASAAILMMAPTAKFGFVDGEEVEDSDPIAWPGRLHLASLKAEDGETLFGGFTEEEFRARELRCMTAAIYFEARGEPRRGQIAVAQVVMNRVRANVYPDTICGVIFQGQWNRNACQFSFACDGKADRPNNKALWARSKELAREVMRGQHWLSDIGYATHYHANYVRPHWARHFKKVKQIGQHIFYKAPDIRVRVADVMDEG
ncbi:cell wall hydrolase [Dichotomicrobium thermohalophilum]|nr:cell wall hydrolase [Dichotomicrobium thermohalophilum]